jgi:hypothetical protein
MPDYTIKLLGLSETIHRWRGALADLDAERRESVARYAERRDAELGGGRLRGLGERPHGHTSGP